MATQTITARLPSTAVYVTGTVNAVPATWTKINSNDWQAIADRAPDNNYHVELLIINAAGTQNKLTFDLYLGLSLITDRTQADVDLAGRLNSLGLDGMNVEQLALWNAGLKGAYNAIDLNRVGMAVQRIAETFESMGYVVDVNPRTDWEEADIPTAEELAAYLADVQTLRDTLAIATLPELPESMVYLDYVGANNIEKVLELLEGYLYLAMQSVFYCGEIYSGEV